MARYIDPVCRQCRRIGEKLYLKGERCYTPRCAVERRKRPPGEQIPRRRRASEWALQLREKQKARWTYGVLERQFRKYFELARSQPGVTGDVLLQQLERRLDNVVYRLSFVDSRKQGRQMVNHGHFRVNGRRMNIPSYQVQAQRRDLMERRQRVVAGVRRGTDGWRSQAPRPALAEAERRPDDRRGADDAGNLRDRVGDRRPADRRVLLEVGGAATIAIVTTRMIDQE